MTVSFTLGLHLFQLPKDSILLDLGVDGRHWAQYGSQALFHSLAGRHSRHFQPGPEVGVGTTP